MSSGVLLGSLFGGGSDLDLYQIITGINSEVIFIGLTITKTLDR